MKTPPSKDPIFKLDREKIKHSPDCVIFNEHLSLEGKCICPTPAKSPSPSIEEIAKHGTIGTLDDVVPYVRENSPTSPVEEKMIYDDFLKKYYNAQCKGCPDGHASFWKTVIESPQWKAWKKHAWEDTILYDFPEVEELGIIGTQHFQDFIKFVKDNNL